MNSLNGYNFSELIYQSSRSLVYRAEKDGDRVICKLLHREYPESSELARFRREFSITRMLEMPGIPRVLSLEPHENTLCMVMEDLKSASLDEFFQRENRAFTAREFLPAAVRIADLLGRIHEKKIIHKDINPANILFNPESSEIGIIDFGISADLAQEKVETLNPNSLEGTIAYISPEQTGRMNRTLDYRTDLYSLGAAFYRMLTNQTVFPKDADAMEMVHFHIAYQARPPAELTDVPDILSDIVLKLLEKNPEDRYQSAFGLKADLERCLEELDAEGNIPAFPLGQKDFRNRFSIPDKLYGREGDLQRLLDVFERVSSGPAEILLVTGRAGLGKSALVHEIHKPITRTRGYFASGKFDQLQRNQPYSALIAALREVMGLILTESEEQTQEWKTKLLDALGPNASVIGAVIPELEYITGKLPEAPALDPAEAQVRFQITFRNFIKTLARKEHPLALFIDDLQWADPSSLKLIESLLETRDVSALLLLGAYRDNEITPDHPLLEVIKKLEETGVPVSSISMESLGREDVTRFVADALNLSLSEAGELAAVCLDKTDGNPFFLGRLLESLHEGNLIQFHPESGSWRYDAASIRALNISDNVADLMAAKIRKLSKDSQETLSLAACIGNRVNLRTLSRALEKSPDETADRLREILAENILVPEDDHYKFMGGEFAGADAPEKRLELAEKIHYRFLHDRVQEAAYSLADEERLENIHLIIGRHLAEDIPESEIERRIFDIVNQLNAGIARVDDRDEKIKYAALNLKAAEQAASSAAFDSAFSYAQTGLRFLDENSWEKEYDLTLALYLRSMESAFLIGDWNTLDELRDIAEANARTNLDRGFIRKIKISALSAAGDFKSVMSLGRETLKLLGLRLPEKPSMAHVLSALIKLKLFFASKSDEKILNLPPMESRREMLLGRLMGEMGPAMYLSEPLFMPLSYAAQINFTLKKGLNSLTAQSVSSYAITLSGHMNDVKSAVRFAALGRRIAEKTNARDILTRCILIDCLFIRHFHSPLRSIISLLKEGYQTGLESGELEFGGYSLNGSTEFLYYAGDPLDAMKPLYEQTEQSLLNIKQYKSVKYARLSLQAIHNLTNVMDEPLVFRGPHCDEDELFAEFAAEQDQNGGARIHLTKLELAVHLDTMREAREFAKEIEPFLDAFVGMYEVWMYHFYAGVAELSLPKDASPKEIKIALKRARPHIKKLAFGSENCPENLQHKLLLLNAESLRLQGKNEEAYECCKKALSLARTNRFLQDEALITERTARYFAELGHERISRGYMEDAYHAYKRWGANHKLALLEKEFPGLRSQSRDSSHAMTQTSTTMVTNPTTSSSHTTAEGSNRLDLLSVVKASQTLSGETDLEKLLKNLMHLMIENAGAERGVLLLVKNNALTAECEKSAVQSNETNGEASGADGFLQINRPLTQMNDAAVSLIQYAARTGETLLWNKGTPGDKFSRDPYLQTGRNASIICLPVLHQKNLVGVFYAENRRITNAFTQDRIEILNLIASQAAISIEKARLYAAYGRFVPHKFLRLLDKRNIMDVELGDFVLKDMAVLFADIRSFTTLSETLSPEETFNFLNSYLNRMGPLIRENGGFIDKYIGDAIMALFSDADSALTAAIALLSHLKEYNANRASSGYPAIDIGVGLNLGSLMLGTIGEKDRMEGTVISDAVNLASRVETLTKTYRAPLLITRELLDALQEPEKYSLRKIDHVRVKGKTKKAVIYEVFDADEPEVFRQKKEGLGEFQTARDAYHDGRLQEARDLFQAYAEKHPLDAPALQILHGLEKHLRKA